jgi:hypothetical protein
MTAGLLFTAPVGTAVDEDSWVPLGVADSCALAYDGDRVHDTALAFDLHGWSASVSFRTDAISPLGYWLLLRKRHPRISAIRRAYRRKTRNR